MRINYVTSVNDRMASFRYRMRIPSESDKYESVFSVSPVDADIHFFSKGFNSEEVEMARQCNKVVYDICDDWFLHKDRNLIAREFIDIADAVTCPTKEMARRVLEETGVTAIVIGDPYEFELSPVKPVSSIKVMWFGHESNINTLDISNYNFPIEIVTNTRERTIRNIRFTPWSISNLRHAFKRNNVVIIPSLNDNKNLVKSPNRVIESLISGMHVVAAPLPSYIEFRNFINIDVDMNEGIKTGFDKNRTLAGQKYASKNYSADSIGEKWKKLFMTVSGLTWDVGTKYSKAGSM